MHIADIYCYLIYSAHAGTRRLECWAKSHSRESFGYNHHKTSSFRYSQVQEDSISSLSYSLYSKTSSVQSSCKSFRTTETGLAVGLEPDHTLLHNHQMAPTVFLLDTGLRAPPTQTTADGTTYSIDFNTFLAGCSLINNCEAPLTRPICHE